MAFKPIFNMDKNKQIEDAKLLLYFSRCVYNEYNNKQLNYKRLNAKRFHDEQLSGEKPSKKSKQYDLKEREIIMKKYMEESKNIQKKSCIITQIELNEIKRYIECINNLIKCGSITNKYNIYLLKSLVDYSNSIINKDNNKCYTIINKLLNYIKYNGYISTSQRLDSTEIINNTPGYNKLGKSRKSIGNLYVKIICKYGYKYYHIKLHDNNTYVFNTDGECKINNIQSNYLTKSNIIKYTMNCNDRINNSIVNNYDINFENNPSNTMKSLQTVIKFCNFAACKYIFYNKLKSKTFTNMPGAEMHIYIMNTNRYYSYIINGFIPINHIFILDIKNKEIKPYVVYK